MSEFRSLYDIRGMVESDRPFICATFLNGLYYGDSWFSLIPKEIFMNSYKKIINGLIDNPLVDVKIACLKEDSDIILGFSILSADHKAVIWCHTKQAWRKKGIAKSIIPENPIAVTHLSSLGKILLPKIPTAVFNPFYQSKEQ